MTDDQEPVVPLSKVVRLMDVSTECLRDCVRELIAKHTPQSPNPHPVGTYLWAREEHARGNNVRRMGWWRNLRAPSGVAWSSLMFGHDDFTQTDWEVTP
jgi:hypothetical protein